MKKESRQTVVVESKIVVNKKALTLAFMTMRELGLEEDFDLMVSLGLMVLGKLGTVKEVSRGVEDETTKTVLKRLEGEIDADALLELRPNYMGNKKVEEVYWWVRENFGKERR